MKAKFLRLGALAAGAILLLSSCEKREDGLEINNTSPIEFIASMPSAGIDAIDTKTTTTDGTRVLWSSDDHISIFRGRNMNEEYKVKDGFGGRTTTTLVKVSDDEFSAGSGDPFDANIAYYPYGNIEYIGSNGNHALGVNIPNTQTYVKGSFGKGSLPMVAVSSSKNDNTLDFKNLFGFLKLQLKSAEATLPIKQIIIKGNNGENLSGEATVSCSANGEPTIKFNSDAGKSITLECNNTAINATTVTDFWIALPPVTFSKGITVEIVTSATAIEKKTSAPLTITRSKVKPMETLTLKIDAELDIPDANFKKFLLKEYDSNGDGKLTLSDSYSWGSVSRLSCRGMGIRSLKGIEFFPYLIWLDCSDNLLTTLDLSKNTALESLFCSDNQLTSLDLSKNIDLTNLYCSDNQLTSFNLSSCAVLKKLNCRNNQLTSLDLRNCTALTELNCYMPSLKTLYLKKGHKIKGITENRSNFIINTNTEIVFIGDIPDDAYVFPEINLGTFNYNELFDNAQTTEHPEGYKTVSFMTWEEINKHYGAMGLSYDEFKYIYSRVNCKILDAEEKGYDWTSTTTTFRPLINSGNPNVDTYVFAANLTPYSKFGENVFYIVFDPTTYGLDIRYDRKLVFRVKYTVVKPTLSMSIVDEDQYGKETATRVTGYEKNNSFLMKGAYGQPFYYGVESIRKQLGEENFASKWVKKMVSDSKFSLTLAKDYAAAKTITMNGTAYSKAGDGVKDKTNIDEILGHLDANNNRVNGIVLGLNYKFDTPEKEYDLTFTVNYVNGEKTTLTHTFVFINPLSIAVDQSKLFLTDFKSGVEDKKDFSKNFSAKMFSNDLYKDGVMKDTKYGSAIKFELVPVENHPAPYVTKVNTTDNDGNFMWKRTDLGNALTKETVPAKVKVTFETNFAKVTGEYNITVKPEVTAGE